MKKFVVLSLFLVPLSIANAQTKINGDTMFYSMRIFQRADLGQAIKMLKKQHGEANAFITADSLYLAIVRRQNSIKIVSNSNSNQK